MNNWLYQYTEKENASPMSVFIPGMQGWVNIQMPVNKTYSIDRIRVKKLHYYIMQKKKLITLSTSSWLKSLSKLGVESNFFSFERVYVQ